MMPPSNAAVCHAATLAPRCVVRMLFLGELPASV